MSSSNSVLVGENLTTDGKRFRLVILDPATQRAAKLMLPQGGRRCWITCDQWEQERPDNESLIEQSINLINGSVLEELVREEADCG